MHYISIMTLLNGNRFALSNVIQHKGKTDPYLSDWALKNTFNINFLDMNYDNSNYQSKVSDYETIEVLITNY